MATFNSAPSHALQCKLAATIVVFAALGIVLADEGLNKIFATRAEVEFPLLAPYISSTMVHIFYYTLIKQLYQK